MGNSGKLSINIENNSNIYLFKNWGIIANQKKDFLIIAPLKTGNGTFCAYSLGAIIFENDKTYFVSNHSQERLMQKDSLEGQVIEISNNGEIFNEKSDLTIKLKYLMD